MVVRHSFELTVGRDYVTIVFVVLLFLILDSFICINISIVVRKHLHPSGAWTSVRWLVLGQLLQFILLFVSERRHLIIITFARRVFLLVVAGQLTALEVFTALQTELLFQNLLAVNSLDPL